MAVRVKENWAVEQKNQLENIVMVHVRNGVPVKRALFIAAAELKRPFESARTIWYKWLNPRHSQEIDKIRNDKGKPGDPDEYVALDDLKFRFGWKKYEVKQLDQWYADGISIWEMARRFNRDPDEVLILIVDRARKQKIKPRPGGVFGNGEKHLQKKSSK